MNQSDSYDLTPREISLVEKLLQEAQVAREKADAAQEKARAALSMLVQSRDLDEGSDWNYSGGKLRRVDRGQQAAAPAAAEPLTQTAAVGGAMPMDLDICPVMISCAERAAVRVKSLESLSLSDFKVPIKVLLETGGLASPQERMAHNALCALRAGYDSGAPLVMYLEDDIEVNRNLLHNLRHWSPLKSFAGDYFIASLCNPGISMREIYRDRSFAVAGPGTCWGAQACVMSRKTAKYIIDNWAEVSENPDLRIFRLAGEVCKVYYYSPSLVQHTGKVSTWGGGFVWAADFDGEFRLQDVGPRTAALTKTIAPIPPVPRLVLDALAARDCNDAERAIELAARAIAEGDRGSSSHIIQASCLGDLRRHGEALQVIEAGLKVCPPEEVPNLVNERAFQEILSGDPDLWQDGWRDWESRPQRRDLARNLAAAWPEIKEWSGERDRVVLVCCDKGLGDTVLFARYLRVLTDRGCTLQLNCSRASTPFADAARGRPGVLGAYGSDAQIPKMAEHWIALESLVQHSEERIPAPYDLGPRWEPRPLDGRRPRVGLCWHGAVGYAAAKHRRPEDRALWDSLAAVEGIDFVSLQLGELGPCSEELPAGSSVMDAARIACGCDLVISVDTSSAHIAATCGVPTLVPLMRLNYWPWLSVSGDGARTPWYSSMRMFRQSKGEEWSWTFGRIKAELRKLFKLDPPTTASRKKVARRAK